MAYTIFFVERKQAFLNDRLQKQHPFPPSSGGGAAKLLVYSTRTLEKGNINWKLVELELTGRLSGLEGSGTGSIMDLPSLNL